MTKLDPALIEPADTIPPDDRWRAWGPYLAERQWGTVREDYSTGGGAWDYFPHDHARSRAYRWGEDGLAGLCDHQQRLCVALALWNGRDPILKERLFGLTNGEGNHGEDVKEQYFFVDGTPSHSYLRMLYKYPQAEFPYARLVADSRRRGPHDPEPELSDTGVFADGRYFDVEVEYGKGSPDDIAMRVTIHNRGREAATIHVLPTVWFRNTWSWKPGAARPRLHRDGDHVLADHAELGRHAVTFDPGGELLFCENETNAARLWGGQGRGPFKDGIGDRVVHGREDAVDGGKVTLRTGARVGRLIATGGRVTGVVIRNPDDSLDTVTARIVLLAAGAVNSAALLLRSDLGNRHDQVGRNYMTHHNGAMIAIARTGNGVEFQKTLGLTDFYAGDGRGGLPLGTVQMMGKCDAGDLADLIRDVLPGRDPADAARASLDFWLTAEDLPDPGNRVAIAADGRIQIHYRPTNLGAYEGLERTRRDLLDRIADPGEPFTYVGYRLGVSGVSHQCGTLRMGDDPRTSVVDATCRVHELDNVYACDASVFPASGAVDPALTIIANALRVGDHVAARLRGAS